MIESLVVSISQSFFNLQSILNFFRGKQGVVQALPIQSNHQFFIKGIVNIVGDDDGISNNFRLIGRNEYSS